MKIAIVGAGALGTVFGAALARRHDVTMLVRSDEIARAIVTRGGLVVDGRAVPAALVTHDPEKVASCVLVIVAVKTYATIDALSPLRSIVRNAVVLSIQNGIDAAADIERALGSGVAIAVGPTTEAARLIEAGVVVRAATGSTVLAWARPHGRARDELAELARAFETCGLRTSTVDDGAPILWAKLVFNAAINPVTALARVTNGELAERPELFERALAIAREVVALAAREGVSLPFTDVERRVREIALSTGANHSSMLQDVERGRTTEIDALLGTVVRRAATFGLAVPASRAAFDEVRRRANA